MLDAGARGFLLVRGETLAACKRPVASCDATKYLTKLLPKPVGSNAKTSLPWRKAFVPVF